ncbi:hypothetical protein Q5692_36460 [Microcoleus sp. C2C3]|uniref:hypothetical protein n=1 Tax=unclassified Microcoleus TaxID=2642155 RepID=UPI002FD10668
MTNKARNTSGRFAPKSEVPRKIRSVNLTDDAWHWLATVAEKVGMSRNDYLEALASSNHPFMETVESQPAPFMETVESQPAPFMETVGTQPAPFMEMVETETKTDAANMTQQPDSELSPLMETVGTEVDSPRDEVEAVRVENRRLHIELGNSASEKELLKQELVEVRSQLAAERAEREENKKSAPVGKDLPEAADLLNKLKAKRKKSKTDLADLEVILELLQG